MLVCALSAPQPIQVIAYDLGKQHRVAQVLGLCSHVAHLEAVSAFGLTQLQLLGPFEEWNSRWKILSLCFWKFAFQIRINEYCYIYVYYYICHCYLLLYMILPYLCRERASTQIQMLFCGLQNPKCHLHCYTKCLALLVHFSHLEIFLYQKFVLITGEPRPFMFGFWKPHFGS